MTKLSHPPHQLTIYTTSVCPFCDRAKALFKQLDLSYVEVNLQEDPDVMDELSTLTKGWRTVPMIFAGETFLGGCTDVEEKHSRGEFLPLLQSGN